MQHSQTLVTNTKRPGAPAALLAISTTIPAGRGRVQDCREITRSRKPVVREYETFLSDGPATCLVWF